MRHEIEIQDQPSKALYTRLRQVVSIHQAMFDKLLFSHRDASPELADLFRDAGATYLRLSEEINRTGHRLDPAG